MHDEPRVLVIAPAYNEEDALETTVSKLMGFPLFDVLIVDDGSRVHGSVRWRRAA